VPGLIKRIEDIVSGIAPEWTTVHVVPRTVPRFPDKQLKGQIRYATRAGSFLPNIKPYNRTTLTETAQARAQDLTVSNVVDGLVPGSLIMIGGRELQLVLDVDSEEKKIQTFNLLKQEHEVGSTVDLFAEQYRVVGPVTATDPATLTVTQGAQQVFFQSLNEGIRGNSITISIVVPGPSQNLTVTMVGLAVAVQLATDSLGAVLTTYQQFVDIINNTTRIPVSCSLLAGSSSAIVQAMAATSLTGGAEHTDIVLRGRFPVLLGDKIWIQSDPQLLLSGTDYEVSALTNQYVPSLNLWNSHVRLNQPIPRDLVIDDIVYLRAFPGYRSNVVNIPVHNRLPIPLGPFVLDYVSGRMNEGQDIAETFSVQQYTANGAPVDSSVPVEMRKNQPIIVQPIHQSMFMFFRVLRGRVAMRNDRLLLVNDDEGRCVIWTDLAPEWVGPCTWQSSAKFISPSPTELIYRFAPNRFVVAGSGALGEVKSVTFTIPGPQYPEGDWTVFGQNGSGNVPANRMFIITNGPPNGEIEMGQWSVIPTVVDPVGAPTVYTDRAPSKLQYSLVGESVGPLDWQAGSLQIKPYFHTIEDLYTQFDFGNLDSGTLLL
jgi:hypothetical protein